MNISSLNWPNLMTSLEMKEKLFNKNIIFIFCRKENLDLFAKELRNFNNLLDGSKYI